MTAARAAFQPNQGELQQRQLAMLADQRRSRQHTLVAAGRAGGQP